MIVELSKFIGQLKSRKQEACVSTKEIGKLRGCRIDKNLVKHFVDLLNKETQEVCSLARHFQTKSTRVKPQKAHLAKEKSISPLSLPYYVTDVCANFFKNVNLGNAYVNNYNEEKFADGMFLDGRDRDSVEKMMSKCFPSIKGDKLNKAVESHNIHAQLSHYMFDNNILNSNAVSNLFSLYSYANKLYSSKRVRVHPTTEFKNLVFNQKVSFKVGGRDILEGLDLEKYDSQMRSLLRRGDEAEDKFEKSRNDYNKWLRADANLPKGKNAVGRIFHEEHNEHDLQRDYTAKHDELEKINEEAADLLIKIFGKGRITSPLPLIKKLLNRNKTFGEILEEYPENKTHGKAFVREGEQKSGDLYGYTATMHNVIKSYMLVPPFLVETRMKQKDIDKLKDDEMKGSIAGMETYLRTICAVYKNKN